jgi:hypothetical protein
MSVQLSKWFYFTVIPALLPLVWLAARLLFLKEGFSVEALVGKGEVLLAASAFAAAGLGDLIASGRRFQNQKMRAGGSCVLIVFFAIMAYADVGTWVNEKQDYNVTLFAWFSICWCIFSVISGGACIILAQRR